MMFLRLWWKTMVGLAAVFVAGVVVGGALTIGAVQRQIKQRADSDTWTPRTLAWFETELKLSARQRDEILPLVEENTRRMIALRSEGEQRWRESMGQLLTEVAGLLDEAQRAELRRLVDRAAEERRRNGGHFSFGKP